MSHRKSAITFLGAVLGLVFVGALLALPLPAQAIDISWHSSATLTYDSAPNYKREGTAVFKNGEKATLNIQGTYDVIDDNGLRPYKARGVYRLDDGSTIMVEFAGSTNVRSATVSGSGEFVGGTGRFDGMAGKFTLVGQVSGTVNELDWVGSYTLSAQ